MSRRSRILPPPVTSDHGFAGDVPDYARTREEAAERKKFKDEIKEEIRAELTTTLEPITRQVTEHSTALTTLIQELASSWKRPKECSSPHRKG